MPHMMKKLVLLFLATIAHGSCALEPEWNSSPYVDVFFVEDSSFYDSLSIENIFIHYGDTAHGQLVMRSGYNHLIRFTSSYDSSLFRVFIPYSPIFSSFLSYDSTGRNIPFLRECNYCYMDYFVTPLDSVDTCCNFVLTISSDAEFSDPSLATSSIVKNVHCLKVSPSK